MLFQTGVDIHDSTCARHSNHIFDYKPWGILASQYALSTCDLPNQKWEKIISAASMYLTEGRGSLNAETVSGANGDGHGRILVSDEDSEMDILGTIGEDDD